MSESNDRLISNMNAASNNVRKIISGKGGDGALNNITNIQTYYAGGGTAGANTNSGTDTNSSLPSIIWYIFALTSVCVYQNFVVNSLPGV